MDQESKPFWQSKTFWVNFLTLLVSVLTLIVGNEWVKENPAIVSIVGVVITGLNVVLRFLTNQAVTFTRKTFVSGGRTYKR